MRSDIILFKLLILFFEVTMSGMKKLFVLSIFILGLGMATYASADNEILTKMDVKVGSG